MNRLIFGCLFLAAIPSYASGQYPNPYVNPYNPYYGGSGYGSGNALSGAADLTRGLKGDQSLQVENARVVREKAAQAKLDTRKQAFDEMLYEKANTPSYTEELTKNKQQLLTRLMNFPTRGEVSDGKTLNAMLPMLQAMSSQGTMGPPCRSSNPRSTS